MSGFGLKFWGLGVVSGAPLRDPLWVTVWGVRG